MKTLIVDDNPMNRKLLTAILAGYGPCDEAVDGASAINAIREGIIAGSPYNLVCLDIMMPEMDGQEALQQIRKIEEFFAVNNKDICKIIMISALSDKTSILKSFTDGCEAYLVKPIDREKLLAELKNLGLI